MSGASLSLSGIDKISEFLHTASKAGMVVSLTEEQAAHVRDAISVLTDIDPYFIESANFKPAELLAMFQRVAAVSNHLRSVEKNMKDFSDEHKYSGSYSGMQMEIEKQSCEHAAARDSLGRLATGIIERARMERTPRP